MADRFYLPFADVGSGIKPSSGAKLFFYEDGLVGTNKDTYTDSTGVTPNSNPVIADSTGVFPAIFGAGSYTVALKDKNDVQIWSEDGVSPPSAVSNVSQLTRNYTLLASAVADTTLVDGQYIRVLDRGNALFKVVLSSTVTENTYNVVQCTGVGTLSLDLVINGVANIVHFGAAGDGATDNSAVIQHVIDYCEALTYKIPIYVPTGNYYGSGYTLSAQVPVFGDGKRLSILTKNADTVLVTHAGNYTYFRDIGLESDFADTTYGLQITGNGRIDFHDVYVDGMGSSGIVHERGNLNTFDNIVSINNGEHGFYAKATVGSSGANATRYGSMDLRGNTLDGFVLEAQGGVGSTDNSLSNFGGPITCQANTRYGARIETRSNFLDIYSENNGSNSILDTAGCFGNFIRIFGETCPDNSTTGNNTIFATDGTTSEYRFQKMFAEYLRMVNYDNVGFLDLEHTADREFSFTFSGSASNATLKLVHDNSASTQLNLSTQGKLLPSADSMWDIGSAVLAWQNTYTDTLTLSGTTWTSGSGTPEGVLTAPIGSMYTRTDGGAGTTLYVKESGAGNTGWVAK